MEYNLTIQYNGITYKVPLSVQKSVIGNHNNGFNQPVNVLVENFEGNLTSIPLNNDVYDQIQNKLPEYFI